MRKFALFLAVYFIIYGGCFAVDATIEAASITAEVVSPAVTVSAEAAPPAVTVEVAAPTLMSAPTEKKFLDVPEGHWAAGSVYDLVNLGVTQGYPDGTFRGNNNITRYETAMFLSKLAAAIGRSGDDTDIAVEKIKDDLRAEIRALRADIAELKRMPTEGEERPISGSYSTRIIFGNLIARNASIEGQYAPVGPIVRYRLKTSFARNVAESARLKINLDTMDSGFGGGSSDLSMKILDIEGDMKLDMGLEAPVDIKVTTGPGPVTHTEEADAAGNYIARSENNVVYVRPYNSIMFSTKINAFETGIGYIARKLNTFGEVEVNQVNAVLGYDFPGLFFIPNFKIDTNVDYLSNAPQSDPPGPTDTKCTFNFIFMPSLKHKATVIYGFGQGSSPHNAMFGFESNLMDQWDTGTTINFRYKKIGAEYLYENAKLDESMFAGLDIYDRYIGNGNGLGVVDVGAELIQMITENVRLIGRSDWRLAPDNSYDKDHPQCSLMIDGGVSWDIATDTLLEAFYRVESIPSAADISTDLAQLSLAFKF